MLARIAQRWVFADRVRVGRAQVGGGALLREDSADRVAELDLVLVEGEAHGVRPQFRGSPSMRSATTLRWISLVPA